MSFPTGIIVISMLQLISFFTLPNKTLFTFNTWNKSEWESWLPYRYITYMFVHQDFNHLICNLIVQLLFGVLLEVVHGYKKVLLIYFISGVFGCLGHSFVNPKFPLQGASAGVYAIVMASSSFYFDIIWNDTSNLWKNLAIKLTIFLLLTGIVSCIFQYIEGQETAAHFYGAVTGVFIGMFLNNGDQ